jgi:hypothetical protein
MKTPETMLRHREITGKYPQKFVIKYEKFHFTFYLIFRSVHASLQIYCIFSYYLLSTKPGLRHLYSCSYTDMHCPVTEVSSF